MRAHDRTLDVACAAAALGAVLVSWRATALYGLGVDGDAVWNLSAGAHFAHGRGLVTCRDEVFSLWPPLYPLSIAALERAGVELLSGLRGLHMAALATSVWLGSRLALSIGGSRWAALATAGSLALSSRSHEWVVQVTSECFFLPLVLGALLAALRCARQPGRGALVLLVVLSAAACLQRYVGVAAVLAIAVHHVASGERDAWTRRLRWAAAYGAASLAPLFAWLLRNRAVEGSWTGGRDDAGSSTASVVSDTFGRLRDWPRPDGWPEWTGWLAWALGLALFVLALRRLDRRSRSSAALAAGFAVLHVLLVASLAASIVVDRVGDRLLLPALPPLIAVGWASAFTFVRTRPAALAAASLVVAAWFAGAERLRGFTRVWRTEGAGGFHTRGWQEHPLALAVRSVPLVEPCWSNAPEFLWLLQRRQASFVRAGAKAWDRMGADAALRGGTLVWFQQGGKPKPFLASLEPHVRVQPLAQPADGLVLRLAPR